MKRYRAFLPLLVVVVAAAAWGFMSSHDLMLPVKSIADPNIGGARPGMRRDQANRALKSLIAEVTCTCDPHGCVTFVTGPELRDGPEVVIAPNSGYTAVRKTLGRPWATKSFDWGKENFYREGAQWIVLRYYTGFAAARYGWHPEIGAP